MKNILKNFLRKKNLYYPIRYSRLFRFYESLFNLAGINQQKKEISFYQSFLPACELIFDIGANNGHKTEAFLTMSEKIVCCEPDVENFKLLQVRFRKHKKRVVFENKALSDKEGIAELRIHHPGSAFNTLSSKWMTLLEDDKGKKWSEQIKFTQKQTVETTTLDRLIDKYGIPDFIKIDVEGLEELVLKGLSHRVRFLSFESILPEYATELNSCIDLVEKLDNSALFNISLYDELILPDFMTKMEMMKWLQSNKTVTSFEIIVKMPFESP